MFISEEMAICRGLIDIDNAVVGFTPFLKDSMFALLEIQSNIPLVFSYVFIIPRRKLVFEEELVLVEVLKSKAKVLFPLKKNINFCFHLIYALFV